MWYARGKLGKGPVQWHILKRLELDTWTPETFCGSGVLKIVRTKPTTGIICSECLARSCKCREGVWKPLCYKNARAEGRESA